MNETPTSIATRRSAMRFRKSSSFTPPRDCTPRQVRIMHPAHLPSGRQSAVAYLNAEHAALDAPAPDPARESRVGRSAPARRPGEA